MSFLSLMHLICCLLRHSSELKVVSLNCTIKVVYLLDGCVRGGREGGGRDCCSQVTVLSSNLSS